MSNGDAAVYPESIAVNETGDTYGSVNIGLTKREYFAAMVMQGFVANSSRALDTSRVVRMADALLKELEK